nr:hypothetical protein [uncultured Blautia sp.]
MLSHPDCVLRCYMYGNTGKAIKPGTIKPMLYQTGDETWESYTGGKPSPSPDYPHEIKSAGDAGEIKTGIYGRNLFNITGIKSHTENGITVTINDDQSFTITGTGSHDFYSRLIIPHEEFVRMFRVGGLKLKAINLNGTGLPSPKPYFSLYRSTGNTPTQIGGTLYHNGTYDIKQEHLDDENVYAEIGMYAWSGFATAEGTFKAILYQDGDGTWEPYKPLQSLSLQPPNGLPGIPVTSGGNYTDSTGQQWVCDEIDLKRGVYIQRVGRFGKEYFNRVILNNDTINEKYIQYIVADSRFAFWGKTDINSERKAYCTHLPLGKDLTESTGKETFWIYNKETIVLILEKGRFPTVESVKEWLQTSGMEIMAPIFPVETPISEELLQKFKMLQTYYPTTIISNSENTEMELIYIADTKTYLDNIKKEVMEAIANTNAQLL